MCKYCESIKQGKKIRLEFKGTYTEDNICDKVAGDECDVCSECDPHFTIDTYNKDGVYYTGIDFYQKVADVVVSPFSEMLPVIYCQFCGTKISDIENFDIDQYKNFLKIQDSVIIKEEI